MPTVTRALANFCAPSRRLEAQASAVHPLISFGLVAALSLLLPDCVLAQASKSPQPSLSSAPDTGGPDWRALTPQQRKVLAPLEQDWSNLNAARKAKWLEVAVRFPSMPAAEQGRVHERMLEWAQLSPAERGRARLSFQESKQLSGEEKQKQWEAYQALPAEERSALANRAKPAATQARSSSASAASPGALVKPVAPTLMQAKPGATTTLMTQPRTPPLHQQPGQPAIAAKPGQVDGRTLLPRSGPQAAASAPLQP